MLKYVLCYTNVVITVLCAIGFMLPEMPASELGAVFQALNAVVFAFLALWVFSIGLLITPVQLIYGVVKLFAKEKRPIHKHHLGAAIITVAALGIIFSISVGEGTADAPDDTAAATTELGNYQTK